MDSFSAVRQLAADKRKALAATAADAPSLLAAASTDAGYRVTPIHPDSPHLAGGDGALSRKSKTIYVSNALGPEMGAFVAAHEFGHLWIETPGEPVIVARGADPGSPEEATPLGLRRVEAYSPQERREQLANVFAREFLLPRGLARKLFVDDGLDAPAIAKHLKLPPGLVRQQLATALLLPAPSASDLEKPSAASPSLDPSQKEAAEHEGSPLLVEAGPGTGKTRTLIARIEYLLGKGVPPTSILVLTFSNKAAAEVRERIARNAPEAAREMWAGTFHSFGLELLRKYGDLVDVGQPVRLLDQADQLEFLEDDLLHLQLDHYLRLHEPLSDLRHVLSAISRAKDELKTPSEYAAAAEQWRQRAVDDDEILKAEKAVEVARVYRHYDARMRREKLVDFGDLIARVVELFERHPNVLADTCALYAHVLVDEYQDVNRASAIMVKHFAGDGRNLWLVGDAKQSIYRFRGAAPVNTRDFERDYAGGVRKSLKVNYRSVEQIVHAFDAFATSMRVVQSPANLSSSRGAGVDPIDCYVATDLDAEASGIADQIRRFHAQGIPFAEQAVLCRTHSVLEKVSDRLEALGVPVLYLGDLFERPEVSDLLALLSFVSEPWRGGLHRLAEMDAYRMPLADVRAFLVQARSSDVKPLDMLARIETIPGVSDGGRAALARLASDVQPVKFMTGPGAFLCRLLFDRGLIRDYLAGDKPADQQRRLAVHQFLQFAIENDRGKPGADPKRQLLDWVRRLEAFGDERSLREPPSAVSGIDAVRLMTVHASKGLEFGAVHLPVLAQGRFPRQWTGQRCVPPPGFYPTSAADDHIEEEECLFFVAMSRAKDKLSLSRAERYTRKRSSGPSGFFSPIRRHLNRPADSAPTWTGALPPRRDDANRVDLAMSLPEHDARDLDQYLRCPRQYLYQRVLGLGGGRDDNPYVRFHRAVYRVLRWLGEQDSDASAAAVDAAFATFWDQVGPADHPLEPLYRDAAERMLKLALKRRAPGTKYNLELDVPVAGARIKVSLDEMEGAGTGSVARRLRTGRKPKAPDKGILHPLIHEAVQRSGFGRARFFVHYLTGDESEEITFTKKVLDNRMETVRETLSALQAGAFPAEPSDAEACPRCSHYFICPSVSD